jgi:hypothetical protein
VSTRSGSRQGFWSRVIRTAWVGLILTLVVALIHSLFPQMVHVMGLQGHLYDLVSAATDRASASPPGAGIRPFPRVVFIDFADVPPDVDEAGATVSRKDLATIIEIADRGKAASVLLDFSLAGQSDNNEILADVLDHLQNTHVVVPAQLSRRTDEACNEVPHGEERSREQNALGRAGDSRKLYGQAVLDQRARPRVLIGSDDIEYDVDGRVRSFCPFATAVRRSDGRIIHVPASALLATAFASRGRSTEAAPPGSKTREEQCKDPADFIIEQANQADTSGAPTTQKDEGCARALITREPRLLWFTLDKDNGIPASQFEHLKVSSEELSGLAPEQFNHAIVVVGVSHPLSTDWVVTSSGAVVPGALLLINIIYSFRAFGLVEGPHAIDEGSALLIEFGLVVLGAVVFVGIHSTIGGALARVPGRLRAHARIPHQPALTANWLLSSTVWLLWSCLAVLLSFFLLVGVTVLISELFYVNGWVLDISGAVLGMIFEIGAHVEGATGHDVAGNTHPGH